MYIGNDLQIAHPSYKIIDDISSGFNGSTTSFALQVSGATPVPFPISTQQVMISVNGVVQEPDPNGGAGFKLLGSNIVFSSAPANGHAFFGVINAGADYVTAGSEFPDGSATAPSFTFQDDQDTGWYRNASGDVGYSSNGTAILNFDGNGLTIAAGKGLTVDTSTLKVDATNNRVGIGLTNPTFTTEIKVTDTTAYSSSSMDSNQTQLRINNAGLSGVAGILFTAEPSSGSAGYTSIRTISPSSGSGDLIFSTRNASSFGERLRIKHNGNVGIGESSSIDARLHVNSGTDNATLFLESTDGDVNLCMADNAGSCRLLQAGGALAFRTGGNANAFGTGDNERMKIRSSGEVGIGTSSPNTTYKAHIKNSTYGVLRLETTLTGADGAYLDFMHDSSSPADNDQLGSIGFKGKNSGDEETTFARINSFAGDVTDATEDGYLTFQTRAAGAFGERLRLDSSGRLLLGTTTEGNGDADDLTIATSGRTGITIRSSTSEYGNIFFSDGTSGADEYRGSIQYYHSNNSLILKSNAVDALTLDSSQNATFAGTVSDSKGDLRLIPENVKTSAYTLIASDEGKHINISSGGVTVANSVFRAGSAVTIINSSGSDQTITQGSGVTIYNTADATTGNRTLAGRGMATILFVSASTAYISGAGLS
jgi:hypothetical protein